jgi:hypothetical protein
MEIDRPRTRRNSGARAAHAVRTGLGSVGRHFTDPGRRSMWASVAKVALNRKYQGSPVLYKPETVHEKRLRLFMLTWIFMSTFSCMTETVCYENESLNAAKEVACKIIEYCTTLIFTIELGLRLAFWKPAYRQGRRSCVGHWARYFLRPLAFTDLVTLLPLYISVFIPGDSMPLFKLCAAPGASAGFDRSTTSLWLIQLRVLRIFKVLCKIPSPQGSG